jgi:hypothetical protein
MQFFRMYFDQKGHHQTIVQWWIKHRESIDWTNEEALTEDTLEELHREFLKTAAAFQRPLRDLERDVLFPQPPAGGITAKNLPGIVASLDADREEYALRMGFSQPSEDIKKIMKSANRRLLEDSPETWKRIQHLYQDGRPEDGIDLGPAAVTKICELLSTPMAPSGADKSAPNANRKGGEKNGDKSGEKNAGKNEKEADKAPPKGSPGASTGKNDTRYCHFHESKSHSTQRCLSKPQGWKQGDPTAADLRRSSATAPPLAPGTTATPGAAPPAAMPKK